MVGLVAALALMLPAPAVARDVARTDPEIGSPAETVYGIPLEEARRDAAPGVEPEAAIRTEHGVGSSTRVPGRGGERSPGAVEEPPRRRGERRRDRRGAARAATKLSGDPSPAATTVLLVLLTGLAATGGVAAGRLTGRRARL